MGQTIYKVPYTRLIPSYFAEGPSHASHFSQSLADRPAGQVLFSARWLHGGRAVCYGEGSEGGRAPEELRFGISAALALPRVAAHRKGEAPRRIIRSDAGQTARY